MKTSRFSRSPLGSFYRSPLGVRGQAYYRIFVVAPDPVGANNQLEGLPQVIALKDEIEKKFGTPVPLSYLVSDWRERLLKTGRMESKKVVNFVFVLGGSSPADFNLWKNWRAYEGSSVAVKGSTLGVKASTEGIRVPAGISQYAEQFDALFGVDNEVDAEAVEELARLLARGEEDVSVLEPLPCEYRDFLFETDYSPAFSEVANNSYFENNQEKVRDVIAEGRMQSARTVVFFNPGSTFEPLPRDVRIGRSDIENSWWLVLRGSGSADPPPVVAAQWFSSLGGAGVAVNDVVFQIDFGLKVHYCSQFHATGAITDVYPRVVSSTLWRTIESFINSQELSGLEALAYIGERGELGSKYGEEGVDRSYDSTEVSEQLLREMIETYGPEQPNFQWKYVGRYDSDDLNFSYVKRFV